VTERGRIQTAVVVVVVQQRNDQKRGNHKEQDQGVDEGFGYQFNMRSAASWMLRLQARNGIKQRILPERS
jgi:hypothetical protein